MCLFSEVVFSFCWVTMVLASGWFFLGWDVSYLCLIFWACLKSIRIGLEEQGQGICGFKMRRLVFHA